MYRVWFTTGKVTGGGSMKRVPAIFFRTAFGHEPVREWLKAMDAENRRRKSRATPPADLALARANKRAHEGSLT